MTNKPQKTTLHAMIDIETMGTDPSAAILTIGVCIFDPYGKDTESSITDDRKFNVVISLEDNQNQGRTLDANTVMWWLRQSKEAQTSLNVGDITNLKNALTQYKTFISSQNAKVTRIWAKSPDFDVVIMRNALKSQKMSDSFGYFESRCVRTLTEAAYPNGDQPAIGVGVAHNALDDAIRQALMVQHCNNVISGSISPRNQ